MRRAFAIAAGHFAFAAARAALASPLPLDYSAPAGCLDRAAFLGEVTERLPRNTGKVQTVRVVIRSVSGEFVARLEVVDGGGATAEREISGLRCDQVSSAMALVVALVLTEVAAQKQSLPAPRPVPETDLKPAAPGTVAAQESPRMGAPGVPSEGSATEPYAAPDVLPPAVESGRSIPFETGLVMTATGGMAPVVAWGAWGYVGIGDFTRPAARLNLGARTTASVDSGPGTAHFDWFGGRLDGCWPVWSSRGQLGVAGCASFEAGVLRGHGDEIDNPDSSLNPWLGLGLLLRPGLRAGDLVFQAELGPTFPLVRRKFVFGTEAAPESTIYELPSMSWHAGIGAGVRL